MIGALNGGATIFVPGASRRRSIHAHVVDASLREAIEALEREPFPTVPKSPDRLEDAVPVSDSVNLRSMGPSIRNRQAFALPISHSGHSTREFGSP